MSTIAVDISRKYNMVRDALALKYELMELPDPTYSYTLHCSKCNGYSKHIRIGSRLCTVKWIAEGERYESEADRDWFRCVDCGEERAFGIAAGYRGRRKPRKEEPDGSD